MNHFMYVVLGSQLYSLFLNWFFFFFFFLGLFDLLINRTDEDRKGGRKSGDDMQQKSVGQTLTPGCCDKN